MALLSGKRNFVNCRLCLTEIHDNNVTLLDGIIKDMLEIILPELNFTICDTPSICKGCLETLKQSYSFKSSCLEVEDKLQDFVNPKKRTLIDLKEVLKKANDIKQISGSLVVCRTCLGLGEDSLYTKLSSYEGDPLQNMVEKCLPETGLDLTKDPSICPMCLEQLEEQFHFIMQCLDTEAKINYYSERKHIFREVDLHNVYLFSICLEETDDLDKQYNESMEHENCDRVSALKMESSLHHIKKENVDEDLVDLTQEMFPAHIKSKIEKYDSVSESKTHHPSNLGDLNVHFFAHASKEDAPREDVTFQVSKDGNDGEEVITSQSSRISGDSASDSDMSVTKESDLLEVRKVTSARLGLRKSQANPPPKTKPKPDYRYDDDEDGRGKSEEEFNKKRNITRKCKFCNFKTKFRSRMKAHMTVNHSVKEENDEEPKTEEKKMLKCRHCPFKTLDTTEYKNHKLQHRKEKERKCPKCSMVFVRPDFLKKHIENHGALKTNNVNTYRKPQPSLSSNVHLPKKRQPSFSMMKPKNMKNTFSINGKVLKMFKCRICPYQTRLKSNYEKHGQTHKKATELKRHRCKICNFETIQKENFLTHMQTHENDAGNKVMKCFLCSFQPATELALRQHVNQVHKSVPG